MNELVKRLSQKEFIIQVNRPEKSVKSLSERIELNYVHVLFEETGTEIGIRLDNTKCDYSLADFENATGKIYLEGVVTLNYDNVKCMATINLATMKGKGRLKLIKDESEYQNIIDSSNKAFISGS